MLSLFSVVGLVLFAQTITSLPTLPSSDDTDLSVDHGLDPNQLSTLGIDPGASLLSLDAPPSDDAEVLLSQQLALNVGSSASTPPASQDHVDPECDKAPKGKRDTGGADTSCPAYFTNPKPPGAAQEAPKKTPEGQQQQQNSAPHGPINVKPIKPDSRGDLRLTPSEPVRNPFGEQDKVPQCPEQYKYTVCGIADSRYDSWQSLFTIRDADLVINFGFGYGMVVRPVLTMGWTRNKEWENRGGIAGWTDALEECGPDPRAIYCCNEYLPRARQAYICEPLERARKMEQCWEGMVGLPSQTVLTCIENL